MRFLFLALSVCLTNSLYGQMPRERVVVDGPVDEVFWAPSIIATSSVTNVPKGDLNLTIMHAFGIVTDGASELFGLDGAANIRFGLDYGVTDRLSVGVGRSRFDKLYDVRAKANLLRQTTDDRIPLEVAVKGDVGVTTLENGFDFQDRLSYFASLMLARRFSDRLSLQVAPMFSHFNTVFIDRGTDGEVLAERNDHVAVGLAGRLVLTGRMALVAEYVPVLGKRSDGTRNALGVGIDLETGGHVFQVFFLTSPWLTEQHVIARNTDDFFDGDFRLGFNVNRAF